MGVTVPQSEKKIAAPDVRSAFPSPAVLAEYKAIDLELMRMIVASGEREQRHRHWRERAPEWTARLGVVCGLLIGLAGLGAAGYIASIGAAVPGAALGAADLVGLVGVFIYGSRQQTAPQGLLPSRQRKPRELERLKSDEGPIPPRGETGAHQQPSA